MKSPTLLSYIKHYFLRKNRDILIYVNITLDVFGWSYEYYKTYDTVLLNIGYFLSKE